MLRILILIFGLFLGFMCFDRDSLGCMSLFVPLYLIVAYLSWKIIQLTERLDRLEQNKGEIFPKL